MIVTFLPAAAVIPLKGGGAFLAGWIWAGLVAGTGLWLIIRGLQKESTTRFLRLLLSTMTLKLAAYGLAVSLVVGFDVFDRGWFVAGLLGGMVTFLAVEVFTLAKSGSVWLSNSEREGVTGDA